MVRQFIQQLKEVICGEWKKKKRSGKAKRARTLKKIVVLVGTPSLAKTDSHHLG